MQRKCRSRIWMFLGVLCMLAVSIAAQRDRSESLVALQGRHVQEPLQELSTPEDDGSDPQKKQAEALVHEALTILRTLDPTPVRSQTGTVEASRLNLYGKVLYYAKKAATTILVHSPASLEEPVDAPPKKAALVGGTGLFGKKLRAAVEKLEAAREIGKNEDAMYLLAQMNFYGNWSHPRNYPLAFTRYKELADLSGNATAQSVVGFMYATGIGGSVERDQAKALLYHTFAALNGDSRSEMTVAFRHHMGIGTPRHCNDASFYYKQVADKAIDYWRSGPPGGHRLIKNAYRLADDEGGVYGEGASVISSGMNALRRGATTNDSGRDLDDILEYLDLMARKGDLSATFTLAKLYYDGSRNLPRDVRKAKRYFTNIAKQYWTRDDKTISGGPPGLERLAGKAAGYIGKMYLRGEGVTQDFTQAAEWFDRGIKTGDASSQNGLGYMYLHGYGLKINRQKAADFFQEAAEQDLPQAQVNLGKLFLEQNELEIAKRYFELAARHGTLESFYYLAEIYNAGLGVERSCLMATAYYKVVAERVEDMHSPMAWANKAYHDGDRESALIGYMMAAEQGYEVGQANVAYLLDEEKSRLPLRQLLGPEEPKNSRNQELALIYWTRSAKQQNTDSLVKMGDYYLAGIGTEMDYEKAAQCYQAASELQASAQALWNLGWMHENGIGVEQDFHLAKRYYDHALETNQEAYLPVTLSLLKLRVRSFWNTITGGTINAIGADPDPKPKQRPTLSEFLKKWYEATPDDYGDPEDIYGGTTAGDDTLDTHVPGDEFYGEFDEDLIESVIILALAAAVAILVYYRQLRQQNLARRQQQQQQQQAQQAGVLPGGAQGAGFPQPPGAPGFGAWGIPH